MTPTSDVVRFHSGTSIQLFFFLLCLCLHFSLCLSPPSHLGQSSESVKSSRVEHVCLNSSIDHVGIADIDNRSLCSLTVHVFARVRQVPLRRRDGEGE